MAVLAAAGVCVAVVVCFAIIVGLTCYYGRRNKRKEKWNLFLPNIRSYSRDHLLGDDLTNDSITIELSPEGCTGGNRHFQTQEREHSRPRNNSYRGSRKEPNLPHDEHNIPFKRYLHRLLQTGTRSSKNHQRSKEDLFGYHRLSNDDQSTTVRHKDDMHTILLHKHRRNRREPHPNGICHRDDFLMSLHNGSRKHRVSSNRDNTNTGQKSALGDILGLGDIKQSNPSNIDKGKRFPKKTRSETRNSPTKHLQDIVRSSSFTLQTAKCGDSNGIVRSKFMTRNQSVKDILRVINGSLSTRRKYCFKPHHKSLKKLVDAKEVRKSLAATRHKSVKELVAGLNESLDENNFLISSPPKQFSVEIIGDIKSNELELKNKHSCVTLKKLVGRVKEDQKEIRISNSAKRQMPMKEISGETTKLNTVLKSNLLPQHMDQIKDEIREFPKTLRKSTSLTSHNSVKEIVGIFNEILNNRCSSNSPSPNKSVKEIVPDIRTNLNYSKQYHSLFPYRVMDDRSNINQNEIRKTNLANRQMSVNEHIGDLNASLNTTTMSNLPSPKTSIEEAIHDKNDGQKEMGKNNLSPSQKTVKEIVDAIRNESKEDIYTRMFNLTSQNESLDDTYEEINEEIDEIKVYNTPAQGKSAKVAVSKIDENQNGIKLKFSPNQNILLGNSVSKYDKQSDEANTHTTPSQINESIAVDLHNLLSDTETKIELINDKFENVYPNPLRVASDNSYDQPNGVMCNLNTSSKIPDRNFVNETSGISSTNSNIVESNEHRESNLCIMPNSYRKETACLLKRDTVSDSHIRRCQNINMYNNKTNRKRSPNISIQGKNTRTDNSKYDQHTNISLVKADRVKTNNMSPTSNTSRDSSKEAYESNSLLQDDILLTNEKRQSPNKIFVSCESDRFFTQSGNKLFQTTSDFPDRPRKQHAPPANMSYSFTSCTASVVDNMSPKHAPLPLIRAPHPPNDDPLRPHTTITTLLTNNPSSGYNRSGYETTEIHDTPAVHAALVYNQQLKPTPQKKPPRLTPAKRRISSICKQTDTVSPSNQIERSADVPTLSIPMLPLHVPDGLGCASSVSNDLAIVSILSGEPNHQDVNSPNVRAINPKYNSASDINKHPAEKDIRLFVPVSKTETDEGKLVESARHYGPSNDLDNVTISSPKRTSLSNPLSKLENSEDDLTEIGVNVSKAQSPKSVRFSYPISHEIKLKPPLPEAMLVTAPPVSFLLCSPEKCDVSASLKFETSSSPVDVKPRHVFTPLSDRVNVVETFVSKVPIPYPPRNPITHLPRNTGLYSQDSIHMCQSKVPTLVSPKWFPLSTLTKTAKIHSTKTYIKSPTTDTDNLDRDTSTEQVDEARCFSSKEIYEDESLDGVCKTITEEAQDQLTQPSEGCLHNKANDFNKTAEHTGNFLNDKLPVRDKTENTNEFKHNNIYGYAKDMCKQSVSNSLTTFAGNQDVHNEINNGYTIDGVCAPAVDYHCDEKMESVIFADDMTETNSIHAYSVTENDKIVTDVKTVHTSLNPGVVLDNSVIHIDLTTGYSAMHSKGITQSNELYTEVIVETSPIHADVVTEHNPINYDGINEQCAIHTDGSTENNEMCMYADSITDDQALHTGVIIETQRVRADDKTESTIHNDDNEIHNNDINEDNGYLADCSLGEMDLGTKIKHSRKLSSDKVISEIVNRRRAQRRQIKN